MTAALQSSSLFRLKKTKEAISSKVTKQIEELSVLISSESNYKTMRATVARSETPLIPFPGVYQGDMVSILVVSLQANYKGLFGDEIQEYYRARTR